jgi:hypothetical protein
MSPAVGSIADAHNTDGLDCWCAASYHLACDECDVEEYRGTARVYLFEPPADAGCWKCHHGLIPLTRAEAEATKHPLIIVHGR